MVKKSGKKKRDWIAYTLSIALIVVCALVIVGISGSLKPLDLIMESKPDGTFSITATGIAEIIIALALGIGLFLRIRQK